MNLNLCHINKNWTLFLDRDGVINKRRVDDYVKMADEFELIDGAAEAIVELNLFFDRIFIVTNQQGVAKGIMTEENLKQVHDFLEKELMKLGARIDKIYYCTDHENSGSKFRKPEIGMALQAKEDFPDLDFSKSIMVGDSLSDMKFGRNAGMFTCYISDGLKDSKNIDCCVKSLKEFSLEIKNCKSKI